jgi:GH25 family lysozyme M1 (1,4-beta-N-acetylmuramidase)
VAVAAAALVDTPHEPPMPPVPSQPGIDVSHWQGSVDWRAVAAAGYRFAFVKATEGRSREDPTFARNRRQATAAGLAVGAYHFARPDASAGDAVAEANEFLRVARPAAGELVPVLDLEVAGPLGPGSLQAWVRTWLDRVRSATGVRPAIYAGPTFWRVHMADTTDFASYPLMLADQAAPPSVPAHGWSGLGWTVWQWSVCGRVPGVSSHCVDLDALRSDRVRLVTMP